MSSLETNKQTNKQTRNFMKKQQMHLWIIYAFTDHTYSFELQCICWFIHKASPNARYGTQHLKKHQLNRHAPNNTLSLGV